MQNCNCSEAYLEMEHENRTVKQTLLELYKKFKLHNTLTCKHYIMINLCKRLLRCNNL